MKDLKIRTAAEILSDTKSLNIKDVMDVFYEDGGQNVREEVVFIGVYLDDAVKLQLFNLGFKYRKHLSPIGETCHVISIR